MESIVPKFTGGSEASPKQTSNGRRTQQQRRAESERKLLTATAQLIVEHGFDQLSLVAIGRRAGCSHALVNHLFGSKAALIERLNEHVDEMYRDYVTIAVAREQGIESVVALAEAYLTLVTSDDRMARVHVVLWAQAVAGTPELRDSRVAWDRHFRQGVIDVIANATNTLNTDPYCESTALVVVGLLRGVAMQHLLDPATVPLAAATHRVAEAVRGLLRRAPTSVSDNAAASLMMDLTNDR